MNTHTTKTYSFHSVWASQNHPGQLGQKRRISTPNDSSKAGFPGPGFCVNFVLAPRCVEIYSTFLLCLGDLVDNESIREKTPHDFWANCSYNSQTWFFREFWVDFLTKPPFGVTNRRFGRYNLPRMICSEQNTVRHGYFCTFSKKGISGLYRGAPIFRFLAVRFPGHHPTLKLELIQAVTFW